MPNQPVISQFYQKGLLTPLAYHHPLELAYFAYACGIHSEMGTRITLHWCQKGRHLQAHQFGKNWIKHISQQLLPICQEAVDAREQAIRTIIIGYFTQHPDLMPAAASIAKIAEQACYLRVIEPKKLQLFLNRLPAVSAEQWHYLAQQCLAQHTLKRTAWVKRLLNQDPDMLDDLDLVSCPI